MAITPLIIPAVQIAGTDTIYYTATNCKARIDAVALTNTTGGAITVTLYRVPSGGSPSSANMMLSAQSIAAGQTYIPSGAIGQWLDDGGTLQAKASAATSVTMVASGIEYA